MNVQNYPTKETQLNRDDSCRTTRAKTKSKLVEKGISNVAKCTFINDATKVWNLAPQDVKNAKPTTQQKG